MADNLVSNPGAGGATFATDDVGGIHYPIGKLAFGALDSVTLAASGSGAVNAGTLRVVLATDQPVIPVSDNGGSLTVDGTVAVTDGGGSLTVDGTVAVTHATLAVVGGGVEASALRVTIATDSTGVLSIDDNGGSLTVDGTVAATQSGAWSVRLTDGTDTADVLDLTNSNPLTVAIVDANGDQITSFGGGTQYTEGDTDATITGVAIMWESGGDTLVPVSTSSALPISDAGGSLTVDGSVSATISDGGGSITVDGSVTVSDGGGSLTVDNAALAVVGGGTEATALRVTIANDSTGVLSVDDNGGSLTVDGSVSLAAALPAGTNNIGDVDVLTVPAPLSTTGGGTEATALRVTVANDSTGVLSVDDNGGSLTVDGSVSLAAAIPAGTNNIGDVDVLTVPAPLSTTGGGTEAAALRVTIANDSTGVVSVDDNGGSLTVDGSVTATLAAGTNTNEVVGDVAQDAAIAGNPLSMGLRASTATPTAMSADGDSVYGWSDRNGAQMIRARPAATATLSNVAGSASSVTLLAANTGRLGAMIYNDSTALLYVKFGATASTSSFTVRLGSQQYYELPNNPGVYTGVIDGIWASATGNARVTEVTT